MNYRNLVLSLCLLGGHIVEAKDLNKAYSFQACCKKEKKMLHANSNLASNNHRQIRPLLPCTRYRGNDRNCSR